MNHTTSPLKEKFPSVRASGKDELREKLIDMYMKIARGFYFEGSDETTEKLEYAPKFADEIMQLIAASNQQAVQKALEELLDEGRTCICQLANVAVCDHNWSLCNEIRDRLAALTAAQPRKDGDEKA